MEVVYRDHVFDGAVSELVCCTIGEWGFDARTSHPAREPLSVVVAAGGALLKHRHPTELRAEHHQCLVQESTTFEICKHGGHRLVQDGAVNLVLLLEIAMAIPVADTFSHRVCAVEDLHEANPTLDQPTRQDAVPREARLGLVASVIGSVQR